MPYQTSPEIDFSSVGLVVDVPSNAIPTGGWSNSLNVRPRNGSVQGVNAFANDILLHHSDSNIANGEAKAVCQFTPAGGSSLIIAYIVKGVNGNGSVILYDTGGSGNSRWNDITNATAVTSSAPNPSSFAIKIPLAPRFFASSISVIRSPMT